MTVDTFKIPFMENLPRFGGGLGVGSKTNNKLTTYAKKSEYKPSRNP
jgi:hypothetical protein